MKIDYLSSEVLRGSWMILPQIAESQHQIVDRLLSHENIASGTLADKSPFSYNTFASVQGGFDASDDVEVCNAAVINLSGVMLKNGTACSYGTTDVATAICEVAQDEDISAIVLNIDSGGGSVSAISPMIEAIAFAREQGKPVVALVDLCASAAYYVACHCDKIFASNDISAQIGSIGVMCSFVDYQQFYEKQGIAFHSVYADQSTDKNGTIREAMKASPLDQADEHYNALKNEQLNPLAEKFQQAVIHNRPGLKQDVPGILSGKMFYARDAVNNGLIDGISSLEDTILYAININLINQFTNK